MTNLRNYMETSPTQTEEAFWDNIKLTPFGQAGGTRALPGGLYLSRTLCTNCLSKNTYTKTEGSQGSNCSMLSYHGKCLHTKRRCYNQSKHL